jgi:type II secretory pathway pseudopilin PulG
MKFNPANLASRSQRARSGFTLAEVLAAMLFLVIVIPVAMQGLNIASRAGEVSQRKMAAARIGNKVLNELKVTGQLQSTSQKGTVVDRGLTYHWQVKNQPWTEDPLSQMTVATVDVTFMAQGRNIDVNVSTLQPPIQQ